MGSPHWLAEFLKKEELAEHVPHPISMKAFRRMQATQAKGNAASHQVLFPVRPGPTCAVQELDELYSSVVSLSFPGFTLNC